MINYLILALSVASLVAAQLFLKKGMLTMGKPDFNLSNFFGLMVKMFGNIYLLAGLFFFGIGFFVWLFALSRFKISVAYPITTSAALALVTLFSWILFKEQLEMVQIVGFGFIILGIFLIVNHG